MAEMGDLRTGYQIRAAAKHDPKGENLLIQLGNVGNRGIDLAGAVRMNLERARLHDLVTKGDVLLRGRGASYRAAVVPACPPGTVAVAPLYVFRVDPEIAVPEYLAWFINRPANQALLAAEARGSYIPTVSINSFAELTIPLPSLEEQRRIAVTEQLIRDEKQLSERLTEKRSELLDILLEQSVRWRK
jgi:restriction endonuclease S subunit